MTKRNSKTKPRKSARDEQEDCSRCTRHGEAFRCYRNSFKFDVDMAREFAAAHEPVELDPEDIQYSLDRAQVNEQHIDHVDPSYPGIVAHVFFPDGEGNVHHAQRLIDGHHRASKCQRLGIPFYVYVLTEEESVRILDRAPEGARPAHLSGDQNAE